MLQLRSTYILFTKEVDRMKLSLSRGEIFEVGDEAKSAKGMMRDWTRFGPYKGRRGLG